MDYFSFGKYKGRKVQDVIKEDPEYVSWCNLKISFFSLTPQQKHWLSNEVEKRYLSKNQNDKANKR